MEKNIWGMDPHKVWDGKKSKNNVRRLVLEKEHKVLQRQDVRDPGFFIQFLAWTEAEAVSDPASATTHVRVCIKLARQLRGRCFLTRSIVVLMTLCTELRRYDRAGRVYRIGIRNSGKCERCRGDMLREKSRLNLAVGDFEAALADAEDSYRCFESIGNRSGQGKALLFKAAAESCRTNYSEALSAACRALTFLPLDTDIRYRKATFFEIALNLVRSGGHHTVQIAKKMMPEIRRMYHDKRGKTSERANIAWLQGVIAFALGQRSQARYWLLAAQKLFARLKMYVDFSAVAVDLTMTEYPDRKVVASCMASILESGIDQFSPRIHTLAMKVYVVARKELNIEDVNALNEFDWDPTGEIREALLKMRAELEELAPEVMPCAVAMRPNVLPSYKSGKSFSPPVIKIG